jgi:hypothetical protein
MNVIPVVDGMGSIWICAFIAREEYCGVSFTTITVILHLKVSSSFFVKFSKAKMNVIIRISQLAQFLPLPLAPGN